MGHASRPLRILVVHNRYQLRGGEDQVFEAEAALLESAGHTVIRFEMHNRSVNALSMLELARRTVWSTPAYAELRALCRKEQPDVAHFHNTLPLISPAGYYAAQREGVPVVQTLHNYRLGCAAATLFRGGRPCELCVGRMVAWPAVVHACYRGSRTASAGVVATTSVHAALGTWRNKVDRYIALTSFARDRFIAAGLPGDRLLVKPNFVSPDPGVGSRRGDYALYVGRLAPEKGITTLLEAWRQLDGTPPLHVVGAGPLQHLFDTPAAGVVWHGQLQRQDVLATIQSAAFLVFPSEWYETFGLTIIEAFASGVPVIAARIGAAAELIDDGVSGRLYDSGNPAALAAAVRWALQNPERLATMGHVARQIYLERYTGERNLEMLEGIYRSLLPGTRTTAPLHRRR